VLDTRLQSGGSALVVINGDDVYEDLFTSSLELQEILTDEGFACSVGMGMSRFEPEVAALPGVGEVDADLIVLYTAMGTFTPAQQQSLDALVRSGTGLIAIHASNVFGSTPDADADGGSRLDDDYRLAFNLIGSRYDSHGPLPHESRFRVEFDDHELTEGLAPFEITHEHYRIELTEQQPQIIAWRDAEYGREPLLHLRENGDGRVCYLQLGHDLRTWDEPAVRTIIGRAAHWAARNRTQGTR
jgi:type 1 glutamine amidotransferase